MDVSEKQFHKWNGPDSERKNCHVVSCMQILYFNASMCIHTPMDVSMVIGYGTGKEIRW